MRHQLGSGNWLAAAEESRRSESRTLAGRRDHPRLPTSRGFQRRSSVSSSSAPWQPQLWLSSFLANVPRHCVPALHEFKVAPPLTLRLIDRRDLGDADGLKCRWRRNGSFPPSGFRSRSRARSSAALSEGALEPSPCAVGYRSRPAISANHENPIASFRTFNVQTRKPCNLNFASGPQADSRSTAFISLNGR